MDETSEIRVGLIGAGYIAGWHAEALRATPGIRLAAVCDAAPEAAEAFARAWGVPTFGAPAELLAAGLVDAVHVLTPPESHAQIARDCLAAGLHVLVEKPMALSAAEAEGLAAAAAEAGRQLAVGHNFLGLPAHGRLKRLLAEGALGRLSALRVDWALPLAPLRSGPYGLWMLREERNLLLELGPHPFAFVQDLVGAPEILEVARSHPIALPGGGVRHQGWRILARAGAVDVTVHLSLVETIDDRAVTLRGSSGMARLDFAADTLIVARENASELILNPLRRELSLAAQHLREGAVNALRQAASLNRRAPYGLSFRATVAAFRDAIRSARPDPRFAPAAGVAVARALDALLARLPAAGSEGAAAPPPHAAPALAGRPARPEVMVIGGTGYIGRALTRALAAQGRRVRVLSRGRHGPFADIADRVETVPVALTDAEGLRAAMTGMRVVFNLARALEKSWEAALAHDVGMTLRIAEAACAAGVGRLVHTGTIASYDMSDRRAVITEDTPFGPMEGRNLYARSKAEGERRLLAFAQASGLAVTIARPGIVLGGDGPLQHWGLGRWHGAGAVRLWGSGRNILPFVLIDDVAEALLRMAEIEAAAGLSFNLVGEPMLSARDYFDAIAARTGARIRAVPGSLMAMWAADAVKWALKRHVLGRRQAQRASLADWRSRGHFARFDNSRPKAVLGWQPEADRERFLDRAIDPLRLFGL